MWETYDAIFNSCIHEMEEVRSGRRRIQTYLKPGDDLPPDSVGGMLRLAKGASRMVIDDIDVLKECVSLGDTLSDAEAAEYFKNRTEVFLLLHCMQYRPVILAGLGSGTTGLALTSWMSDTEGGDDTIADKARAVHRAFVRGLCYNLLHRPIEFVMRTDKPRGARALLSSYKSRYIINISLSKPRQERIGVGHNGHHSGPTGIRMPEYHVQPFLRRTKTGKLIQVRGHRRGDPSVARKTIYKVVP